MTFYKQVQSLLQPALFEPMSFTQWNVLALIPIGLLAVVLVRYHTSKRTLPPSPSNSASVETHPSPNEKRQFGEWTPVPFSYPEIAPIPRDIASIKPPPYRPFRWGDYHVTMGIRSMPWDEWIEVDNQLPAYHRIKDFRINTKGHDVYNVLTDRPGVVESGRRAAVELVHELSNFLSKRHPTTYTAERGKNTDAIESITIKPLNVSYDLPPPLALLQNDEPSAEDADIAMKVSAMLVQDDLALMIEGQDGTYYLQAGAICLPGFWRFIDKAGMSIDDIHLSGNVPKYREKLQTSFQRFFRRLPIDKPVVRNNYFVQVVQPTPANPIDPDELSWSDTTNGPELEFVNGNPTSPPELPKVTPETLRFRTERQSLRRLPLSGAVLFTIRTYIFPITELAQEKGVAARMASAVRSWPEDVDEYKGKALYGDVLLEYLDRIAQEQAEDKEGIEMHNKKYPY